MASLLLVITGASRGLGRAIGKAFCQWPVPAATPGASADDREEVAGEEARQHSHHRSLRRIRAVLVARSAAGMEETKRQMMLAIKENDDAVTGASTVEDVKISIHEADLGDLDRLDSHLDEVLRKMSTDDDGSGYDRIVWINNAGSLGHTGPCLDSPSLLDIRRAVDLNLTSTMWTTVRFLNWVRRRRRRLRTDEGKTFHGDNTIITVVNVSSLAAVQVFPTMGLYSANKAGRDFYHSALARELSQLSSSQQHQLHADDGDEVEGECREPAAAASSSAAAASGNGGDRIKILNYAPGPLETDMTAELRSCDGLQDDLRNFFRGRMEDPDDSARRLVRLVWEDRFESGKHVDFYDLEGSITSS